MDEKFHAGDVVQLKSGGPDMTVLKIYEKDEEARCGWFVIETVEFKADLFPIRSLTLIKDGPNES